MKGLGGALKDTVEATETESILYLVACLSHKRFALLAQLATWRKEVGSATRSVPAARSV